MMRVPCIENDYLLPEEPFAVIIGAQPSRGARSPSLWNAVYAALDQPCRMWPFDVTVENLPALMDWLSDQAQFVGGAVAVPHKQAIARWLGEARLHDSARGIEAVNALSRRPDGTLLGANTDGLAAAQVLQEAGLGEKDEVLLFGFGGAAKAVANTIRPLVASLRVVTRAHADPQALDVARRIGIELLVPTEARNALAGATVLINGTLLGSAPGHLEESPLPPDFVALARQLRMAFDVVYQPTETRFLASMPAGVIRLGGGRMNFLQAVHGFRMAHPGTPVDFIYKTMQKVFA